MPGERLDLGTVRIELKALEERLTRLPPALRAVVDFVRAELPTDIHLEEQGDILLVRHRPEKGSHAFDITLFPPGALEMIVRYEQLHKIKLPEPIRAFLAHINGAFLWELSFFGIPASMAREPPLLSRTGRNPFDIATAALIWRGAFPASADEFHFGSRNAGWALQYGYFLRPDGGVVRYPRIENSGEAKQWPSFDDFLREELEETRRHRPAYLMDAEEGARKAGYGGGWRSVARVLGLKFLLSK